jgi:hypothetical protein
MAIGPDRHTHQEAAISDAWYTDARKKASHFPAEKIEQVRACIQRGYLPFMQPGNRSSTALLRSSGDIQLPKVFLAAEPAGTVSLLLLVLMYVRLSTRATSRGSVRASQLEKSPY